MSSSMTSTSSSFGRSCSCMQIFVQFGVLLLLLVSSRRCVIVSSQKTTIVLVAKANVVGVQTRGVRTTLTTSTSTTTTTNNWNSTSSIDSTSFDEQEEDKTLVTKSSLSSSSIQTRLDYTTPYRRRRRRRCQLKQYRTNSTIIQTDLTSYYPGQRIRFTITSKKGTVVPLNIITYINIFFIHANVSITNTTYDSNKHLFVGENSNYFLYNKNNSTTIKNTSQISLNYTGRFLWLSDFADNYKAIAFATVSSYNDYMLGISNTFLLKKALLRVRVPKRTFTRGETVQVQIVNPYSYPFNFDEPYDGYIFSTIPGPNTFTTYNYSYPAIRIPTFEGPGTPWNNNPTMLVSLPKGTYQFAVLARSHWAEFTQYYMTIWNSTFRVV